MGRKVVLSLKDKCDVYALAKKNMYDWCHVPKDNDCTVHGCTVHLIHRVNLVHLREKPRRDSKKRV